MRPPGRAVQRQLPRLRRPHDHRAVARRLRRLSGDARPRRRHRRRRGQPALPGLGAVRRGDRRSRPASTHLGTTSLPPSYRFRASEELLLEASSSHVFVDRRTAARRRFRTGRARGSRPGQPVSPRPSPPSAVRLLRRLLRPGADQVVKAAANIRSTAAADARHHPGLERLGADHLAVLASPVPGRRAAAASSIVAQMLVNTDRPSRRGDEAGDDRERLVEELHRRCSLSAPLCGACADAWPMAGRPSMLQHGDGGRPARLGKCEL